MPHLNEPSGAHSPARVDLPTLRRTPDQYAKCTPSAVSGGSQAQMYYFVEDAKHDIAALVEALREAQTVIGHLVRSADSMGDACNSSMADEAIATARAFLKGAR